ncbi:MAG TPA: hypothetical protein VM099_05890 [Gemmatimonadaceae bacterium]|nr:hypothetical protein [Gemmatimonadaceae bacterium]
MAIDLNDQGRLGLGQDIGPAAKQVEGTVRKDTDSAYALSVRKVSYLNGQSNPWTGEQLTVRKSYIGFAQERKYSRSRSYLAAAAAIGAAAALILTRTVFAPGSAPRDPGGVGTPGEGS